MDVMVNGSSCSSQNLTVQKIGQTFVYCLILAASLLGNSSIAIVVYKTKQMRKPTNFFIVNMAMSDLLFAVFLCPWFLTELYVDSWLISGPLGLALCKLINFVPYVSSVVSVQSLVLIAVDRFGAVVFPLRSPLISFKLCPLFISITWIVALAVNWQYLIAVKLVEYPAQLVCVFRWKETFGESSAVASYFIAVYLVFHYIPIALLAILYSIILFKLKTRVHPGEQSTNAYIQRERRNRNTLKMAIAIVLGFVLCSVPYSILVLLIFSAWDGRIPHCDIAPYYAITLLLALLQCVINPIICFVFSTNYRQGIKRLVTRDSIREQSLE